MGRRGNPHDSTKAESSMKTLKVDLWIPKVKTFRSGGMSALLRCRPEVRCTGAAVRSQLVA